MNMTSEIVMSLPNILLVEDSDDDIFFVSYALEKAGIHNPLAVAKNGKELVAYLKGMDSPAHPAHAAFPALLLLDLQMPQMNGFEVLNWLKTQPGLDSIAVVVLSNSYLESDRVAALRLGADDVREKPSSTAGLTQLVQELCDKWLMREPVSF